MIKTSKPWPAFVITKLILMEKYANTDNSFTNRLVFSMNEFHVLSTLFSFPFYKVIKVTKINEVYSFFNPSFCNYYLENSLAFFCIVTLLSLSKNVDSLVNDLFLVFIFVSFHNFS